MVIASHVYVDLDAANNDLASDIRAPALRFQETRNAPYIGGSADYLCSFIRFSIQTGISFPVFIPRIELGQEDVNKTVYAITLDIKGKFGGSSQTCTQQVQFTTMDATAPTPEKTLQRQDLPSASYYVYNYIDVINLVKNIKNLQCLLWRQGFRLGRIANIYKHMLYRF